MALSHKQRAFIDAYLRCWNATQAAIEAGYSSKTAYSIGWENLRKPEIAAEIQHRVDERAMSANEVLVRLAEQARAEYSVYLTPAGVDLHRMIADGKAHLIKGFKETAHGRVVEFHDAQTALVHIGKHHQLFTEKVEHEGEVVIRVEYGTQRVPEKAGGEAAESPSETE